MTEITSDILLIEFAALVSQALEDAGLTATLSGGAAVSIYSENRYESSDLDFVTAAGIAELKSVLEPLGFVCTGQPRLSVFEYPNIHWYLEFPPGPLSFGGTYFGLSDCAMLNTRFGSLRIISATQSIMDRLAAASAWDEPQSLEQAALVAEHQLAQIDWQQLAQWVRNEGIADHRFVVEFYKRIKQLGFDPL